MCRASNSKKIRLKFQGPLNGGVSNGRVSRSGLVLPFFVLFCPLWDFPDFSGIFPICSGMVRDFPDLSFSSFLGLLRAPTRNSPERVRDTIWTVPEKSGKHPGLETPRFSFSQKFSIPRGILKFFNLWALRARFGTTRFGNSHLAKRFCRAKFWAKFLAGGSLGRSAKFGAKSLAKLSGLFWWDIQCKKTSAKFSALNSHGSQNWRNVMENFMTRSCRGPPGQLYAIFSVVKSVSS